MSTKSTLLYLNGIKCTLHIYHELIDDKLKIDIECLSLDLRATLDEDTVRELENKYKKEYPYFSWKK